MKESFFRRHSGILSLIIMIAVIFAVYFISGLRPCAVVSGSMEPNLPTWSLCLVSTRTPYEELEEGDIIVYIRESDGKRIIHRVIEIDHDGIVTKGDANAVDDGKSVTEDNFYGKYLFHIPYLGKLPALVRTPVGIAVLAVIAVVLIVSTLHDDRRDRKQEGQD